MYSSILTPSLGSSAAKAVEMDNLIVGIEPNKPEPKKVYLDRPFVYMLIDCENNIPFFMGTVMSVE